MAGNDGADLVGPVVNHHMAPIPKPVIGGDIGGLKDLVAGAVDVDDLGGAPRCFASSG